MHKYGRSLFVLRFRGTQRWPTQLKNIYQLLKYISAAQVAISISTKRLRVISFRWLLDLFKATVSVFLLSLYVYNSFRWILIKTPRRWLPPPLS